jgi:chromatin remodeling complex protein RSC6
MFAQAVYEEYAQWVSIFIPKDKINILHAKRFSSITIADLQVLLKLRTLAIQSDIREKKDKLKEKEEQDIKNEEVLVQSLL